MAERFCGTNDRKHPTGLPGSLCGIEHVTFITDPDGVFRLLPSRANTSAAGNGQSKLSTSPATEFGKRCAAFWTRWFTSPLRTNRGVIPKDFSFREPRDKDRPKGVMLLGVQCGGKSLAAKAVAGIWNVPLLRGVPARNLRKKPIALETLCLRSFVLSKKSSIGASSTA